MKPVQFNLNLVCTILLSICCTAMTWDTLENHEPSELMEILYNLKPTKDSLIFQLKEPAQDVERKQEKFPIDLDEQEYELDDEQDDELETRGGCVRPAKLVVKMGQVLCDKWKICSDKSPSKHCSVPKNTATKMKVNMKLRGTCTGEASGVCTVHPDGQSQAVTFVPKTTDTHTVFKATCNVPPGSSSVKFEYKLAAHCGSQPTKEYEGTVHTKFPQKE